MMIPFHEALAQALVLVTEQTIEFCRGQVIAVRKDRHADEDALYEQPVPLEIVPELAKQLKQPLPESERENLSPSERMRRHMISASHGLARMLDDAGISPIPTHVYPKSEIREYLYREALAAFAITYAKSQDDQQVVSIALETAKQQDNVALQLLLDSDQSHQFFACARWADQAFPLVQLAGHRYAAALMSTTVPETVDVRPPWKAFLIEVPEGLIATDGPDGQMHDVTYVMVHTHDGFLEDIETPVTLWTMLAFSGMSVLHRYNQTIDRLRAGSGFHEPEYAFSVPLGSRDERSIELLTRLVLSVCVAMSDPDRIKPLGKHRKGWTQGPGRISKEPELRTFRVGKPIELDCRPAVRSYIEGHRRGLMSVQFLVRGHWREQPCGPRRSMRKTIWIEPYWKGPEDAPINLRSHVIPDDPASPPPSPRSPG